MFKKKSKRMNNKRKCGFCKELTKEEAKLVRYVLYVAQALFRKCYARS